MDKWVQEINATIEAIALCKVAPDLTPHDLIKAAVVASGPDGHILRYADRVFDSLCALGIVESDRAPDGYTVRPEADFKRALRALRILRRAA